MGWLTASQFGVICHTSLDSPSQSLVSSILSPQPISTPAIRWEIDHEENAKEVYCKTIKEYHEDFVVPSAGLHVNPLYPHLGASPDRLVGCFCCGKRLLKIKCSYSIRDEDPLKVQRASFFLHLVGLVRSHNYYYQVQGQMMICNLSYCNFVCWTPKGIHIERFERDIVFSPDMKLKLGAFFM